MANKNKLREQFYKAYKYFQYPGRGTRQEKRLLKILKTMKITEE